MTMTNVLRGRLKEVEMVLAAMGLSRWVEEKPCAETHV
jgi:hypothetical protein